MTYTPNTRNIRKIQEIKKLYRIQSSCNHSVLVMLNEMYAESESYEQRKTLAQVIGILEDQQEKLMKKTEKVIVFYLNNN